MNTTMITTKIAELSEGHDRFLVGIAGPPGAGKSTLAQTLHEEIARLGLTSRVVPMDGFHLDNKVLDERGLRQRKGAPETFDGNGFVDLVTRLDKGESPVSIPGFDRASDAVVPDQDEILFRHKILLIEGNYLLLKSDPWYRLADMFDLTIFVNPGLPELENRLVQRWIDNGFDQAGAENRAHMNDIPNAKTVLVHSITADIEIGETG